MEELDVVVLGGGFGGLYMLYRLREAGFRTVALEAGTDVGGAWYWNRYPGARCDVESLVYCYTFSPEIDAEWRWSERYAGQQEIRDYLSFVSDRLDLRRDIRFNSRLAKAVFDETDNKWTLTTEAGDLFRAQFFISCAGPISAPVWPDIPGREKYQGELLHSALWPQDQAPDFRNKRVAVIGTGSSATQLIPIVAEQAGHLTVFVRTPGLYMPAFNRPLTDEDYARWNMIRDEVRAKMRLFELVGSGDIFMEDELVQIHKRPGADYTPEERRAILDRRYVYGGATVPRAFCDVGTNLELNDQITEFLREQPRKIIKDPQTADILTPHETRYGQKRVVVGTDFYETFNRDNVTAISVKDTPIESFTEKGLIIDGVEHEFDTIISASGFDALTGALTALDIQGVGSKTIKAEWSGGSSTYLGFGVAGFPNLLMVGGPGSPSVLVNVVMANEYQVNWIADALQYMRDHSFTRIDVDPAAQEKWGEELTNAIKGTVLESAKSWYVGTNVPGKARGVLAYAGGLRSYIAKCEDSKDSGYSGFKLS